MSNAPQGQKPQAQKSEYSNQSNVCKAGNNNPKEYLENPARLEWRRLRPVLGPV